jgi:hypothetical protein
VVTSTVDLLDHVFTAHYVCVCVRVFRVALTTNNHHFPNTKKILTYTMGMDLSLCEIENGVLYEILITSFPSACSSDRARIKSVC